MISIVWRKGKMKSVMKIGCKRMGRGMKTKM